MNRPIRSECSECGSTEIERVSEEDIGESVCTDCGCVFGTSSNESLSDNGSANKEEKYQTQSEGSDWEYWYPCPECGSTSLKQTQVAIVIGTEDGKYGGEDDPDFDESIECVECGEVLK